MKPSWKILTFYFFLQTRIWRPYKFATQSFFNFRYTLFVVVVIFYTFYLILLSQYRRLKHQKTINFPRRSPRKYLNYTDPRFHANRVIKFNLHHKLQTWQSELYRRKSQIMKSIHKRKSITYTTACTKQIRIVSQLSHR